jgi:hypothetical protein
MGYVCVGWLVHISGMGDHQDGGENCHDFQRILAIGIRLIYLRIHQRIFKFNQETDTDQLCSGKQLKVSNSAIYYVLRLLNFLARTRHPQTQRKRTLDTPFIPLPRQLPTFLFREKYANA